MSIKDLSEAAQNEIERIAAKNDTTPQKVFKAMYAPVCGKMVTRHRLDLSIR